MNYIIWIALLLLGFILLIKGADFFVGGSTAIARILNVPTAVIGLTIVALGTSAPEASVSITASINGNNAMALSNVVGSNIFNLLVVIGLSALINNFDVDQTVKKRDLPFNIMLSIILLFFAFTERKIVRIEGIALLVICIVYMIHIVRKVTQDNKANVNNKIESEEKTEKKKKIGVVKSIIFMVLGLAAIILGGDFVVNNASNIASSLGLSQLFIGLTIVAVGTSLPELITSVVASKKGENGMALGNAVGSSILNVIFILGLSATISPIAIKKEDFFAVMIDIIILIIVSMILQLFCVTRDKVSKFEGATCMILYIAYMVYVVLRSVI